MAEQTLQLIQSAFSAMQDHDLDRFRDLLAEDATLYDPSSEAAPPRGPAAIAAALAPMLKAFPDLQIEVRTLVADGARAAAEVVRTGTHTGDLELLGGTVPPTGREVRLPECIVFEVRDGQIQSMTTYVDRLHVLKQLDAAPDAA